MDTPSGSGGVPDSFDAIEAQLDALLRGLGAAPTVAAPERAPAGERTRVLDGRRDAGRDRRLDAGQRRIVGAGAVLSGVVLVVALLVVALVLTTAGGDDRAIDPADASATRRPGFPAVAPDALGPEPRLAPIGVRSLDLGFEAVIVATPDQRSCAGLDRGRDAVVGSVRWYDPSPSTVGRADRPVAPGEHGVALLLAHAGPGGPLDGIAAAGVGTRLEVARSDGTVLGWRVIDVLAGAPGSDLADGLLTTAREQRLVVVACGVEGPEGPSDLTVLALRVG